MFTALFFSFVQWLLLASMLLLFILATWAVAKRNAENKPWLLKYALFALPLPWIAAQTGWYSSRGRQPWSIGEILPTHLSASSLSTGDVYGAQFSP